MELVPDGAVLTSVPLNDSLPVVRAAAGARESVTASPTPNTVTRDAVTCRLIFAGSFLRTCADPWLLGVPRTADYPKETTRRPPPRSIGRYKPQRLSATHQANSITQAVTHKHKHSKPSTPTHTPRTRARSAPAITQKGFHKEGYGPLPRIRRRRRRGSEVVQVPSRSRSTTSCGPRSSRWPDCDLREVAVEIQSDASPAHRSHLPPPRTEALKQPAIKSRWPARGVDGAQRRSCRCRLARGQRRAVG